MTDEGGRFDETGDSCASLLLEPPPVPPQAGTVPRRVGAGSGPGAPTIVGAPEPQPSASSTSANQAAVFARAIDAGDVWISGIGVGANSADVLVNSPDWRGSPELARQFFYHGLGTGQYRILGANVVFAGAAKRARQAEHGR
jgi:hypothetical protein